MESSVGLQVWAARLCLATVVVLAWAGMYFENIRFIAPAAGFLILARGVLRAPTGSDTGSPPEPLGAVAGALAWR